MTTQSENLTREANEDARRSTQMVGVLMLAFAMSCACMAGAALVYLALL